MACTDLIRLCGQELSYIPSVLLPAFWLTVTVEKVGAVAAVAHCFPCSSPPTVYGLGGFQHGGFGLQ